MAKFTTNQTFLILYKNPVQFGKIFFRAENLEPREGKDEGASSSRSLAGRLVSRGGPVREPAGRTVLAAES
jgi:hypothetical protein